MSPSGVPATCDLSVGGKSKSFKLDDTYMSSFQNTSYLEILSESAGYHQSKSWVIKTVQTLQGIVSVQEVAIDSDF